MDARNSLVGHITVGFISFLTAGFFWLMFFRDAGIAGIWSALGYTAFFLLAVTLSIGPLTRIRVSLSKMIVWRGEFGIWFTIMALAHATLILWSRDWKFLNLLGFRFSEEAGRYISTGSAFGLAIILGVVAIFWALVLAFTSSGKAIKFLGPVSWKRLHYHAYVVFYLAGIHAIFFLFLSSFAEQNLLRFFVPILFLSVVSLQIISLIKTTIDYRQNK